MVRAGVLAIVALSSCRLESEGLGVAQRDSSVDVARSEDTRVAVEETAIADTSAPALLDAPSDDYFLLETALDWYDARDECIALGGHLATITSATELARAQLVGTGDRWLGLRKDADAGVFAWVTGEEMALDAWKLGEPNGTGSCGKIVDGGEWRDHSCLEALPALCERDRPVAPAPAHH